MLIRFLNKYKEQKAVNFPKFVFHFCAFVVFDSIMVASFGEAKSNFIVAKSTQIVQLVNVKHAYKVPK